MSELDEKIADITEQPMLKANGYDECMLGVTTSLPHRLVYDSEKIVASLVKDGMSEYEAWEYFYYNIEGDYVGETAPIYIYPV